MPIQQWLTENERTTLTFSTEHINKDRQKPKMSMLLSIKNVPFMNKLKCISIKNLFEKIKTIKLLKLETTVTELKAKMRD